MELGKYGILQFPWTGNREITTTVSDVATQFTSQELAARYKLMKEEMDREYRRIRMRCVFNELLQNCHNLLGTEEITKKVDEPIKTETSFWSLFRYRELIFKPIEFKWFFQPRRYFLDPLQEIKEAEDLLLGEVCERPRPTLPKTRKKRDPPPRVSRRSSQVSQPVYQRHRFQPQSRKQSSSRRQR